jgi:tetratricopeptide (TPR) repeat protein
METVIVVLGSVQKRLHMVQFRVLRIANLLSVITVGVALTSTALAQARVYDVAAAEFKIRKLYERGNFRGMKECADQHARIARENNLPAVERNAKLYLAQANVGLRNFESAVQEANACLKLDKDQSPDTAVRALAFITRALAYYGLKNVDKAKQDAAACIALLDAPKSDLPQEGLWITRLMIARSLLVLNDQTGYDELLNKQWKELAAVHSLTTMATAKCLIDWHLSRFQTEKANVVYQAIADRLPALLPSEPSLYYQISTQGFSLKCLMGSTEEGRRILSTISKGFIENNADAPADDILFCKSRLIEGWRSRKPGTNDDRINELILALARSSVPAEASPQAKVSFSLAAADVLSSEGKTGAADGLYRSALKEAQSAGLKSEEIRAKRSLAARAREKSDSKGKPRSAPPDE